jgi:hypothetical protein
MEREVVKRGKQGVVIRFILAKEHKDKTAAWKQRLFKLLHVFNVRSIDFSGSL